jgi:hypothetical protein
LIVWAFIPRNAARYQTHSRHIRGYPINKPDAEQAAQQDSEGRDEGDGAAK